MRRILLSALALASLPLLSGCGETAAATPAPVEKAPAAAVAEKPAPAAPAPRRVAARSATTKDGMMIIPTMPLPKGWSYMGEADLRKG